MAARKAGGANFISEWFGQRIYPTVRLDEQRLLAHGTPSCPFLSNALHATTGCVKAANSAGVCTVNSSSNGAPQDWIVCPYRVIDSEIVEQACRVIFGLDKAITPFAVPLLNKADERKRFTKQVKRDGVGFVFFQDKLGGEISVLGTPRSPELAFDVTLVEIRLDEQGHLAVSRWGILEIQTMDYHGTYRHAVSNLRDGLRLHPQSFAKALTKNLAHWSGEHVEGPNIANVFKRTFYQTLVKFQLVGSGNGAAGTVLALPRSVWQSWQPFLGAPELDRPPEASAAESLNAFICVFDLDADSRSAISPVRIEHFVRVSPERLAQRAFTLVPEHIRNHLEGDGSVLARIDARLRSWWPDFGTAAPSK